MGFSQRDYPVSYQYLLRKTYCRLYQEPQTTPISAPKKNLIENRCNSFYEQLQILSTCEQKYINASYRMCTGVSGFSGCQI